MPFIQKQDSVFLRALHRALWTASVIELIVVILSVSKHSEKSQMHSSVSQCGFGREFSQQKNKRTKKEL